MTVVEEKAGNFHAFRLFVRDWMRHVIIKAQNLRIRNAQQDWRMRGNDKLRSQADAVMDFREQGQLALRGQGSLRFIQYVETSSLHVQLSHFKEAFPV